MRAIKELRESKDSFDNTVGIAKAPLVRPARPLSAAGKKISHLVTENKVAATNINNQLTISLKADVNLP